MDSLSWQEGTHCVWIRVGQWKLKVRNCLCEFGCSFARIWLPVQCYVTRSQYGDCFTVLFVSVTTIELPKDDSSSLNGADPYHHSSSSPSMSPSPSSSSSPSTSSPSHCHWRGWRYCKCWCWVSGEWGAWCYLKAGHTPLRSQIVGWVDSAV